MTRRMGQSRSDESNAARTRSRELASGCVGESDDRVARQAARHVHLDRDDLSVDPTQRGAADEREHNASSRRSVTACAIRAHAVSVRRVVTADRRRYGGRYDEGVTVIAVQAASVPAGPRQCGTSLPPRSPAERDQSIVHLCDERGWLRIDAVHELVRVDPEVIQLVIARRPLDVEEVVGADGCVRGNDRDDRSIRDLVVVRDHLGLVRVSGDGRDRRRRARGDLRRHFGQGETSRARSSTPVPATPG